MLLGLSETIDQLAMANGVCWYGHVLRREDGHVLRRALDFQVESQRKIERLKRTWLVKKESVQVCLRSEDALCRLKWNFGINQIAAGFMVVLSVQNDNMKDFLVVTMLCFVPCFSCNNVLYPISVVTMLCFVPCFGYHNVLYPVSLVAMLCFIPCFRHHSTLFCAPFQF